MKLKEKMKPKYKIGDRVLFSYQNRETLGTVDTIQITISGIGMVIRYTFSSAVGPIDQDKILGKVVVKKSRLEKFKDDASRLCSEPGSGGKMLDASGNLVSKEVISETSNGSSTSTPSQNSPVKKFRGAILSSDGFILDEN